MRILNNIQNILYRYPLSLIVIGIIIYLTIFYTSNKPITTSKYADKIVHFTMYAGLCLVLWFEYMCSHRRLNYKSIVSGAVILPIIFSGGLEIAQATLTTTRKGDFYDFLANSLGVLFAVAFSLYITRPIIKRYKLYRKHIKEE